MYVNLFVCFRCLKKKSNIMDDRSNDDVIMRNSDISNLLRINFILDDNTPKIIDVKRKIENNFSCDKCGKSYSRKDSLKRHLNNFDHDEDKIRIKKEIKSEIRNDLLDKDNMDAETRLTYETDPVITDGENEPLDTVERAVHEGLNDEKKSFDHGDQILTKKDTKLEIKNKPLDKDNMDVESHSYKTEPMATDGQKDLQIINDHTYCLSYKIDPMIIDDQRKIVNNFSCDKCGKSYARKDGLKRHLNSFDHDDKISIKSEIINQPLDKDIMDVETLSYETVPMIIEDETDPKMNNNFEFKEEYSETQLELDLLINEMRQKHQWTFRGEPWIANPIVRDHFLGPLLDNFQEI